MSSKDVALVGNKKGSYILVTQFVWGHCAKAHTTLKHYNKTLNPLLAGNSGSEHNGLSTKKIP